MMNTIADIRVLLVADAPPGIGAQLGLKVAGQADTLEEVRELAASLRPDALLVGAGLTLDELHALLRLRDIHEPDMRVIQILAPETAPLAGVDGVANQSDPIAVLAQTIWVAMAGASLARDSIADADGIEGAAHALSMRLHLPPDQARTLLQRNLLRRLGL